MAVDVDVPELGESVSEVTILEWLKSDGDYVEQDEPICVLETDKANVDLPSPAAGILHPTKEVDDTLSVGDVLATIEPGDKPADTDEAEDTDESEPAQAEEDASESEADEAEADTDEAEADEPEPAEAAEGGDDDRDLSELSPAVRRLVEENDIDPSRIDGTGRGGRLIKQDVMAYLKEQEREARDSGEDKGAEAPKPATRAAEAPEAKDAAPARPQPQRPTRSEGGERREPMSRIRKRIAQRLTEAQRSAAMLTTFNEVDLSEVMALRRRHKERFQEKHGVSLGIMSFFSRASIMALQDIPAVNASIEGDDIVYHDYVNLGIAVSSDRGLMVPIVHGAERLSMAEVEAEIKRLAGAARDGKLSLDELQGGTFTITNGGVFGSMMSTPILTPPQTGILGMHAIKERPVAVEGEVVIRPMMYTALTYDHRLVDGEQSVKFLVRLKELLEDPARLFLDV